MALDRLSVTIMVTDAERAELDAGARGVGLSLPQYIALSAAGRCGKRLSPTLMNAIAKRTTPGGGCRSSGWSRRSTSRRTNRGRSRRNRNERVP
jgi:hypothetical protein